MTPRKKVSGIAAVLPSCHDCAFWREETGQHDEILRATADMESPLLVEVTEVSAVEPAI